MLNLFAFDKRILIQHCEQQDAGVKTIPMDCGFVETSVVNAVKAFEAKELRGHIQTTVDNPGMSIGSNGAVNGAQLKIDIPVSLIVQFKEQILA